MLNGNWYSGIDASPALHQRTLSFVTAHPPERARLYTLVEPFGLPVWLLSLCAVSAMAVSLVVASRASFHEGGERDVFTLSVLSVGTMIAEAMPNRLLRLDNNTRSMRIVLVTCLPLLCLLGMAYQSNLLAFLVKVGRERPIDTYQDVLDANKTMYVLKGSLVPHLLATSPSPLARRAFNATGRYFTMSDGPSVKRDVIEQRAVLSLDSDHLSADVMRRGKELHIIDFYCGYYHARGHPVLREMDALLLRMLDAGIFKGMVEKHLWRQARASRDNLRKTRDVRLVSLTLGHLKSVWAIVLPCLVLGLASLVIEYCCKVVKRPKKGSKAQRRSL